MKKQEPTYYAMIPKMATLDLDPFEMALYCNLKQTVGEKSGAICKKSNATLAAETRMSITKVQKARVSLEKRGYIKVTSQGHGKPAHITVCNVWVLNQHICSTQNQSETSVLQTDVDMQKQENIGAENLSHRFVAPLTSVLQTDKEEPYKKNQEEEKKETTPTPFSEMQSFQNNTSDTHDEIDNDTVAQMQGDVLIRTYEQTLKENGAPQTLPRNKFNRRIGARLYRDGYTPEEVRRGVLKSIEEGKPIAFNWLPERLAQLRLAKKAPQPEMVYNPNLKRAEWGVNHFVQEVKRG